MLGSTLNLRNRTYFFSSALGLWPSAQLKRAKQGQVRSGEAGPGQVVSGQVRSGHVMSGQVRSGLVRSAQARSDQVR